jgi:hypothetical protein
MSQRSHILAAFTFVTIACVLQIFAVSLPSWVTPLQDGGVRTGVWFEITKDKHVRSTVPAVPPKKIYNNSKCDSKAYCGQRMQWQTVFFQTGFAVTLLIVSMILGCCFVGNSDVTGVGGKPACAFWAMFLLFIAAPMPAADLIISTVRRKSYKKGRNPIPNEAGILHDLGSPGTMFWFSISSFVLTIVAIICLLSTCENSNPFLSTIPFVSS